MRLSIFNVFYNYSLLPKLLTSLPCNLFEEVAFCDSLVYIFVVTYLETEVQIPFTCIKRK